MLEEGERSVIDNKQHKAAAQAQQAGTLSVSPSCCLSALHLIPFSLLFFFSRLLSPSSFLPCTEYLQCGQCSQATQAITIKTLLLAKFFAYL